MSTTGTQPPREHGFTLLELCLVIAIIAIAFNVVITNIGALIPERALDAQANKLIAEIDFLRSEARLQSRSYTLELDLDRDRFRYVMPPELRTRSDQPESKAFESGWRMLDERIDLAGYQTPGKAVFRKGRVPIVFDPSGFTNDAALFLRLKSDENYVWTIRIHGISGRARTLTDTEGHEQTLPETLEGTF